jgi:hypothetical protein
MERQTNEEVDGWIRAHDQISMRDSSFSFGLHHQLFLLSLGRLLPSSEAVSLK